MVRRREQSIVRMEKNTFVCNLIKANWINILKDKNAIMMYKREFNHAKEN